MLFPQFYSCENAPKIVEKEVRKIDSFNWYLLKYSDGTYGVEVENNIILSNCPNKIYITGYNGDYAFKTRKENDHYLYNLSGDLLFVLPNTSYVSVKGFLEDGKTLKNGYILFKNLEEEEGIYNLNGEIIIEPNDDSSMSSPIYAKIGINEWSIFGFEIIMDDYYKIYDYNGNLIVSSRDGILQESKGTCPIFRVEKSNSYWLYNYKGERIINVDDEYYDYDIIVNDDGYSYIVCRTESARKKYYEYDKMPWFSINGQTLKNEGTTKTNRDAMNKDKDEYYQVKKELANRNKTLPSFNNSTSSNNNINHTYINTSTSYNSPTNNNFNNNNIYNSGTTNHNSVSSEYNNTYWEAYYKDTYNRYSRLVESHFSTLNTLISTSNGNGTSYYAISNTKNLIKNGQNDMRRIRNEAKQNGIFIPESYLETKSY